MPINLGLWKPENAAIGPSGKASAPLRDDAFATKPAHLTKDNGTIRPVNHIISDGLEAP
jgi:hypothetical protein